MDERSFTLRLEVWACCELEDRTGQLFDALIAQVNRGRVKELRWLAWAALQARHAPEAATPEIVGDWFDALGGVTEVRSIVKTFLAINADDRQPERAAKARRPVAAEPGSVWRRLYLDARQLGMRGEDFWRLSLREVWLEMAAYGSALKHERDRDRALAWWIANLVWAKQLPDLDKILGAGKPLQRQSPEEQRLVMETLSNQLGIPIRRVPKVQRT